MPSSVWPLVWLAAVFYAGGVDPMLLTFVWCCLLLMVTRLHSPVLRPGTLAVLLTVLLLWILLSIPLSALPAVNIATSLTVAALTAAFFAARAALAGSERHWPDIQRPLNSVGLAVAVFAVAEALIKQARPFGTFEDLNAPAAFWNALFFPTYLTLLSRWQQVSLRQQSPRLLGFLMVMMAALALSDSLGGKLCFFGGLLLSTLLSGWRRVVSYKALGITLAVFIGFMQLAAPIVASRDSVNRLADPEADQSITDRIEMVKSTWQIYLDHPFTGSGLGTYKILYPAVRSPADVTTSGDLAHNDYAQFLAEGGPLLLGCLLAVVGWTLWRLGQLIFKPGALGLSDAERLQTGGYAVAVMCLCMHAAVNFIFYVLPLSLIVGVYLARVEAVMPRRQTAESSQGQTTHLVRVGGIALLVFVISTMGLQSLFIALSSESCTLRACREIRQKDTPVLALANLVIALQPTWLPARDYLIARLRNEAEKQTDDVERVKRRELAAMEVIAMIKAAPAVHYPYALLADLLVETPSIARLIPANLPHDAAGLYGITLRKRPQDQLTRLALAQQLDKAGQARQAFDLVNEDGMRWWKTAIVQDSERVTMLRYMIPRAVSFGLCAEARGMAGSLGIFEPTSALAKVAGGISAKSGQAAGCGLADPLPSG